MNILNLNSSLNTTLGVRKQNTTRIRHAKKKVTEKYKKQRQRLRVLRKNKVKEKEQSHMSGSFSTGIKPDVVDFHMEKKSIDIKFLSDDDVGVLITMTK